MTYSWQYPKTVVSDVYEDPTKPPSKVRVTVELLPHQREEFLKDLNEILEGRGSREGW